MNRNYLDSDFFQTLAPDLDPSTVKMIISQHPNLDPESLAESILSASSLISPNTPQGQEPLPRDLIFTQPCKSNPCKNRICTYYHTESESRRDPNTFNYNKIPCRNVFFHKTGTWGLPSRCLKKNNCKFAHSENEITYHNTFQRRSDTKDEPKVAFIKFERVAGNDLKYIVENCSMLSREIADKARQLEMKKAEAHVLNSTIEKYSLKLACSLCKSSEFKYLSIECCHATCSSCVNSSVCSKCGKQSISLELNF